MLAFKIALITNNFYSSICFPKWYTNSFDDKKLPTYTHTLQIFGPTMVFVQCN